MILLDQLSSNITYTILGLATSLSISGDITNEKYINAGAKISLVSAAGIVVKKNQENLAKITQDYEQALKGYKYLNQELDNLKTTAPKTLEKPEKFYDESIEMLAQKISDLQSQYDDVSLDIKALSLLCNREFNEVEETVNELDSKWDLFKQENGDLTQHKTQQKIQSLHDKLHHKLGKIEAKFQEYEEKIQNLSLKKKTNVETLPKKRQLTTKVTINPASREDKTFIFIDQANFHHSCRKLGIEPDYKALMLELRPKTGKFEIRIYVGVFPKPSNSQKALIQELNNLGYKVIEMPIQFRKDGNHKLVGDDVRLCCDAVEMAALQEIKPQYKVTFVTSDGDYFPALEKIRQRNIDVISNY